MLLSEIAFDDRGPRTCRRPSCSRCSCSARHSHRRASGRRRAQAGRTAPRCVPNRSARRTCRPAKARSCPSWFAPARPVVARFAPSTREASARHQRRSAASDGSCRRLLPDARTVRARRWERPPRSSLVPTRSAARGWRHRTATGKNQFGADGGYREGQSPGIGMKHRHDRKHDVGAFSPAHRPGAAAACAGSWSGECRSRPWARRSIPR